MYVVGALEYERPFPGSAVSLSDSPSPGVSPQSSGLRQVHPPIPGSTGGTDTPLLLRS